MPKLLPLFILIVLNLSVNAQSNIGKYYGDEPDFIRVKKSGEYKISEHYKVKVDWDDRLSHDPGNLGYYGGIKKLTIYQDGRVIDVIHNIEDGLAFGEIEISFADYNKDGYLDITVPRGSGKSVWYNYYIFNPKTNSWEKRKDWNSIVIHEWIDKEKQIFTTRPDGTAFYGDYLMGKMVDGALIPLAKFFYQEDENFNLLGTKKPFKKVDMETAGGVEIDKGHMFYFNAGENSYTLELEGDVSVSFIPKIKVDDQVFFFRRNMIPEDQSTDEIFEFFRNKELDNLSKLVEDGEEIYSTENSFTEENGTYSRFWEYEFPPTKNGRSSLWEQLTVYESYNIEEGDTVYILDVIHDNLFFRIALPDKKGKAVEAQKFLKKIADGFRFYKNGIDPIKLAKNVSRGKNYYTE